MSTNESGIKAGRAFVVIDAVDKTQKVLRSIQTHLNSFAGVINSIGTKFLAIGSAITIPLLGSVKSFASAGDSLDEMSARTGLSTAALQEFGLAADLGGSSLEGIEPSIKKMILAIGELERGTAAFVATFRELHLTFQDLKNLSPEDQFRLIGSRIQEINGDTQKVTRVVSRIFGKQGTALIPILDGLEQARGLMAKLNLGFSEQDVKIAAKAADAFTIFEKALKNIAYRLGAVLAPALTDVIGKLSEYSVLIVNAIKDHQDIVTWISRLGVGLVIVGLGLTIFSKVITTVSLSITGVINLLKGFVSILAMISSPLGALIALVGVATVAFYTYSKEGRQDLESLKETAVSAFEGITNALKSGDIKLAGKIFWTGLKLAWAEGTDELARTWIEFLQIIETTWENAVHKIMEIWHSVIRDIKIATAEVFKDANGFGPALFAANPGLAMIVHDFLGWDKSREDIKQEANKNLKNQLDAEDKLHDQKLKDIKDEAEKRRNQHKADLDKQRQDLKQLEQQAADQAKNRVQAAEDASKPITPNIPAIVQSPKLIDALELGSVEAAKQAWENNQTMLASKTLEVMEEQLGVQKDLLDEIREGGLIGV